MANNPFDDKVYQDTILQAMKAYQLHDPLKEAREAMEAYRLHDPLKEAREAMEAYRLHDPLKEAREAMEAYRLHDPLKEAREAMEAYRLHDPLKEAWEAMKSYRLYDPLKDAQDDMRSYRLLDPFKMAREAITALHLRDPFIEAQRVLKSLRIDSIVDTISQERWPLAYEDLTDFVINNDGTLTVDSQTISYGEIRDIVEQITDNTLYSSVKRLEQALDGIVNEIRALKNPTIEKIITLLIYPIIVGIILSILNPITDYYIKEYLSKDKKQIEKQLKKNIIVSVKDSNQLRFYKIVSRDRLDVRFKPLPKSSILGKLYFGQAVVVIDKKKKWSLVAWSDSDEGIMLQGWVLSKYLNKIR